MRYALLALLASACYPAADFVSSNGVRYHLDGATWTPEAMEATEQSAIDLYAAFSGRTEGQLRSHLDGLNVEAVHATEFYCYAQRVQGGCTYPGSIAVIDYGCPSLGSLVHEMQHHWQMTLDSYIDLHSECGSGSQRADCLKEPYRSAEVYKTMPCPEEQ